MAVAGGFRLAFWSEQAEHHGPRLERALARYARYVDARPAGFPAGAIAAFARFLADHTPRQDGPEHGMAYDVQRFNELTKQMSAYAHYARDGHLQLAAARARRRDRARQLAEQRQQPAAAALPRRRRRAWRGGCGSPLSCSTPTTQPIGPRAASSTAKPSGQSGSPSATSACAPVSTPAQADGRYRAACSYAQRWGLQMPPGRWTGR